MPLTETETEPARPPAPGLAAATLDVTVPGMVEHVRELREQARAFAVAQDVAHPDDVALGVSEACTMAVLQGLLGGTPGFVRLSARRTGRRVHFRVEEDGASAAVDTTGLAVAVMAKVADGFAVRKAAGGGLRLDLSFATG